MATTHIGPVVGAIGCYMAVAPGHWVWLWGGGGGLSVRHAVVAPAVHPGPRDLVLGRRVTLQPPREGGV